MFLMEPYGCDAKCNSYSISYIFISILQATGFQLGTMMEAFAGILTAIIIAFYAHWLLTLVVLGFVPFMVIAGLLQLITFSSYSVRDKTNENATKVLIAPSNQLFTPTSTLTLCVSRWWSITG